MFQYISIKSKKKRKKEKKSSLPRENGDFLSFKCDQVIKITYTGILIVLVNISVIVLASIFNYEIDTPLFSGDIDHTLWIRGMAGERAAEDIYGFRYVHFVPPCI